MPLPSLANTSSSPLQALTPVPMAPEWISQRGRVSSRLLKLECIAVRSVVDRQGVRSYVIELFERTSKLRATSTRSSPSAAATSGMRLDSSRKSIARIERRYAEFADLWSQLYTHAHNAHNVTPCDFCSDIVDEVIWGDSKPSSSLVVRMTSDDKVMRALTKSLNTLLAIVARNGVGRLCAGQDNVPQLLYTFLFGDDTAVDRR